MIGQIRSQLHRRSLADDIVIVEVKKSESKSVGSALELFSESSAVVPKSDKNDRKKIDMVKKDDELMKKRKKEKTTQAVLKDIAFVKKSIAMFDSKKKPGNVRFFKI